MAPWTHDQCSGNSISPEGVKNLLLGNVIFWGVASIVLILSIVISIRRIWLPYSKFLVFFIACYVFLNLMSLLNMPNWINHIGFGIVFLIFPILDGISTNIALTKYGGKEANPIMAWVIKKISIRFAMFIPFITFLIFVILYWETTDSSVLYGLYIVYFAVILNNGIVILRNKKKLDVARKNSVDIS
jgi:hypothetical protein